MEAIAPLICMCVFAEWFGGNDINKLTQLSIDGADDQTLWDFTKQFVQQKRDALDWLTKPGRFPNGIFVVFANMYEFTDGTGDVGSCPASSPAPRSARAARSSARPSRKRRCASSSGKS